MSLVRLFIITFFVTTTSYCYSQQNDSTARKVQDIPQKFYTRVDKKLSSTNKRLTKKSIKYIAKFQRHEKRLQQKLGNLNADATNVFTSANEKYNQLTGNIKSKITKATGERSAYIPRIDSLSTSLSFLKKYTTGADVAKPIASLTNLQNKLQQSEKIKEFVAERKQQIKELLSKYTKIPAGLKREFTKLKKSAWYYQAQVLEIKETLKDSKKAERKALSLLNKLPAFEKFMKKHSQLASMFRTPDNQDGNPIASLAGLQTRASVQALIQQQISAGGPNARQIIQQNLAQAHSELDKLKEKLQNSSLGSGGEGWDDTSPLGGSRMGAPNSQKTKPFLKRFELGTNFQFAKSSNLLPSTTSIGISLGYKLNDKLITGVGFNYKMGMGTIRHIVISHQGIGLRSSVDYKIKGSLFMSGGFEANYNAQFKNIDQLKRFNEWQQIGLVGISKKYFITKNKQQEIKLLYDFLANNHIPQTQPIIVRFGFLTK